jgi:hypothetical protein
MIRKKHTRKSTTVIFTKPRRFKTPKKQRERLKRNNRNWRRSPQGAYVTARVNAGRRGIEWGFTFESWWKLWEESGKWVWRGRKAGCYCMARLGDSGPYAPFNCLIVPFERNCAAAAVTAGITAPENVPESCELSRNYC